MQSKVFCTIQLKFTIFKLREDGNMIPHMNRFVTIHCRVLKHLYSLVGQDKSLDNTTKRKK